MKKTITLFLLCSFILSAGAIGASFSFAAETSSDHTYSGVEWSYQGNDVPETYWTPWLPLVSQQLTRFRIGFRFSSGSISVKCPVKLTFKYDPANAQSGKDLPVKVKAELVGANYKTFESAFGLHLPNEFQLGFIGITGVPDFLPWYTLPWDICEILDHIPGLPQAATDKITAVCTLIANAGVNMQSEDALPLPGEASYHDKRTLLNLKLTDFFTDKEKAAFKTNFGISLFNGLSSKLGSARMGKLLLVLEAAKGLSEAGATEFLTDKCIDAGGAIIDFANIQTIGDPYFRVEGVELNVLLRAYIPGGKGSGTYPLTFTSSGQEQTITFRDITPFVQAGDKLVVVADSINYRFKIIQGLLPIIKLGLLPDIHIDKYEKYFDLGTAKKDFDETEYKGEIPLTPSNDPIQSLRAQPGCTSVQVNWTSPIFPLKGSIQVFDGNTLVKTVNESAYRAAHNNIITNLIPEKTYRFKLSAVAESGLLVSGGYVDATTKKTCQPREQSATCNSLSLSSTPIATAGDTYVDFSWTTNQKASTMLLISPAPDLSANYVACVKKQDGTVNQGWVTQGGLPELVKTHTIRIVDLDPGTHYYYNVVSWTYDKDDPTKDPMNRVGYVGEINTQAPPPPPSIRLSVSYQGLAAAGVTVTVSKVGSPNYHATLVVPNNGLTEPLMVEPGKSYIFKVLNQGCYQDYTSSSVPIAANAQGELASIPINLQAIPPKGAYVYDTQGKPLSGVSAGISGASATSNASGYYTFGTVVPNSNVSVTLSKAGYITAHVNGLVTPCGRSKTFTIENCILKKTAAKLTVYANKQDGYPIPGASISVKEGSTSLGSASTDSQGKAILTINFSTDQEHTLTVTSTAPSSLSGTEPVTDTVKLAPEGEGTAYPAFFVAPADTQPPVISDVSLTQTGPKNIAIFFKVNEAVSQAGWDILKSTGQLFTSSRFSVGSLAGSLAQGYTLSFTHPSMQPGTYKVIVKAKDLKNYEGQSVGSDFTLFGGNLWNIKLSGTRVTSNSITISWDKYPYNVGFGKYALRLNCPSANTLASTFEVSDINTTVYTFNNLLPGKFYQIFLTAKSSSGADLALEWSMGTTTSQAAAQTQSSASTSTTATTQASNAPPVIKNFAVSTQKAQVDQEIELKASMSDDVSVARVESYLVSGDSKQSIANEKPNEKSVQFIKKFKIAQAGTWMLYLAIYDDANRKAQVQKVIVVSQLPEKQLIEKPFEEKQAEEQKIEEKPREVQEKLIETTAASTKTTAATTTAEKTTAVKTTAVAVKKEPLSKINIKKITLKGYDKGMIPSGGRLSATVEVSATDDFDGPFAVNVELKKGKESQKFTKEIMGLKKEGDSFTWDLVKKMEDGSYTLVIEISSTALKLKDKTSKFFKVGEKKTTTKQ